MQTSLTAASHSHRNPVVAKFLLQYLGQENEAQAFSCLDFIKVSIQ